MYIDMNVAGFGCHSGGISHKATAEKLVFFITFHGDIRVALKNIHE